MGGFVRARRYFLGVAAATVWAVSPASGAFAQGTDAAEFYQGKVIKLLIGAGPGGGYDAYARLIAPHLERKTGATVVVENRPGGGGLLALNRMVAAKPDGLTLMIVNGPAAALAQLLAKEGVRFDVTDLVWLGRVAYDPRLVMWSAKSPFRTLADGLNAPRRIKWGAGDKADWLAVSAAFASEALGLDSLIITGYKGAKEVALAAIRGEVDGISVSAGTGKKFARGGKMIPVVVLGRERSSLFPDVQTIFEEVSLSEDAAWWIDYQAQALEIGRAIATTPGVPESRAAFLRGAIREILTNPDVIAEAGKIGRGLDYAPPDRVQELVAEMLTSLDEEKLARVKSVVLEKYY